jgi:hypothetical protein
MRKEPGAPMTEILKYSVIKNQKEIELRRYAEYIQAEVSVVDTEYKSAVEKGFNVLAGYIFGNNTARQKVEMTTPVQVSRSQRIAMTAPVIVSGKDRFTVAFIMPSKYTLETLPIPNDGAIRITSIPAHQMAAIRFSGYFRNNLIDKNKERLTRWLEAEGLEPDGDFIVAGYNPPWVPGIFARNEILIKIKEKKQ